MKYYILSTLLSVLCVFQAFAQNTVTGAVTDEQGNPVAYATVLVVGTNRMALTGHDGNFSIEESAGDVLEFSFMGMKTETVSVGSQRTISVVMQEDRTLLDDVVVVGYGTQKKASITGAISKVDGEKLAKAPAQRLTNLMGGVIPGVITYQPSGVPGGDGSTLLIRGSGVKAIVDGVPRGIDDIDPDEVESISVLKDASAAAIYGFNAEAVMIITTKRGDNKPSRISYNGSFTVSQNAVQLELLDGPGFAYYYNLGREMDGDQPVFTKEMVNKMTNGDDSDGWGNTDWYKEIFGMGFNQNHSVSATGGNDRINYFTTIGFYNQQGNVSGYTHDRVNIRGNIETKIASNLTLTAGLLGRFTRTDRPGFSANPNDWANIGQQVMRAHPYVPMKYDGYNVGTRTASSPVSPLGAIEESGYGRSRGNVFQGTGSLRYDFPFVKGLSAKVLVGYDVYNSFAKNMAKPYQIMIAQMPISTAGDISYIKAVDQRGTEEASVSQGYSLTTNLMTNLSLNYHRVFGKSEIDILALLEAHKQDSESMGGNGFGFDIYELDDLNFATNKTKNSVYGSSSHSRSAGYVGRIDYSYDNRYLAELSCRYDGSYLFYGSNKTWGYFPALSLGWRIDREPWFPASRVDLFKIRTGAGITASSPVGAYQAISTMSTYLNSVILGGISQTSLLTSKPGNPELTWQKSKQINFGLDLTMWEGRFRFEGDVFYKYLDDMIVGVSGEYPASWGGRFFSSANVGKQDHKGFEFLLEHRNHIRNFNYGVSLVGSYTYRRWLSYPDAANTPDYRKVTGTEVGSVLGFIAEGLFRDQAEIDRSATIPGSLARPGDIKYRDRNGDGRITYDQDMGYVKGSVYPHYEGGINLDANWKGIDFTMRWNYGLGRTIALTGVYTATGSEGVMDHTSFTRPFYHSGNAPKFLAEGCWTEKNKDARFPRLSVSPGNNNAYASTWWYENGNYLRLKQLQIGYSLPGRWMQKINFKNCRVFFEGTNLLTFSKVMRYNIDPEMPSVNNGYYPQQRLMGFGLELQF